MEFGAVKGNKTTVLILVDQYVAMLAAILPRICDTMCANDPYVHKDGNFRLTATKAATTTQQGRPDPKGDPNEKAEGPTVTMTPMSGLRYSHPGRFQEV